ncbi:MAG: TIGR04222 domain-containing membrane protein [Nocardia sp.]|nr:TIGR04222 domain-containing membrane protein [Nocardia sp.]NUS92878.1 TIGR04222 domain-containing membrane protein [Nocardia sp.]
MHTVGWAGTESTLFAGDTWGISGPGFLLIYLPFVIVAVVIGVWLRRRIVAGADAAPAGELTAPELGMLTSDRRAVMASVALLRGHDLIDAGGRPVGAATTTAALDPFTLAVRGQLGDSKQSITLVTHRLRGELDRMRKVLVDRGLLADGRYSKQLREAGLPILVVASFGVARLVTGLFNGNPVLILIFVLVALGIAWWRVVAPVRITPAGRAALAEAANAGRYLRPGNSPSYETYGPAAAGLAVALFGVQALVLLDPALNSAMGGYSAEGVSGGGDSGGGDAGGGGCGGGGGGCGGGGCGGCGG